MTTRICRQELKPLLDMRPDALRQGVITFCIPLGEEFHFIGLEEDTAGFPVAVYRETKGVGINTRVFVYAPQKEKIHAPRAVSRLGSFKFRGQRLVLFGPKDHNQPAAAPGRRDSDGSIFRISESSQNTLDLDTLQVFHLQSLIERAESGRL